MSSIVSQIQDQQPHERRVLIEFLELQEKMRSLRTFLAGKDIHQLGPIDQNLLFEQYRVMGMYLGVLENRIERFAK